MPHELDPIDDHIRGDSITFGPWTVEQDGSPRDLTDDTLEWFLLEDDDVGDVDGPPDPDDAVLSHEDDGVSIDEADAASGEWAVEVDQDTTDAIALRTHVQVAVIDALQDRQQTFTGEVVPQA